MNCHHFRATQKSIPDAQELIWLGGGVKRPHPAPLGLIKDLGHFIIEQSSWQFVYNGKFQNLNVSLVSDAK